MASLTFPVTSNVVNHHFHSSLARFCYTEMSSAVIKLLFLSRQEETVAPKILMKAMVDDATRHGR